jgi:hypothetical protein
VDEIRFVDIHPTEDIKTDFIELGTHGYLKMKKGYAWDGASGPTWDDNSNMLGGLVHDALYQLMREEHLPINLRKRSDEILREICIEKGMTKFRAWYWIIGLKWCASGAAKKKNKRKIHQA